MNLYKCKLVKQPGPPEYAGRELQGPDNVAAIMSALYGDSPQEVVVAFALDSRHRIRGLTEVTRGIMDTSLVHAREVFRNAILANAAAIIVAHNHPSGDCQPSPEDHTVTRQLVAAGQVVGIPVIDHVIIGDGCWHSMAAHGEVHT